MDTFQGTMKTVSPAIGSYTIDVFMDIDKNTASLTGPQPTGAPIGTGTLELVRVDMGVTGISEANFTNMKPSYF